MPSLDITNLSSGTHIPSTGTYYLFGTYSTNLTEIEKLLSEEKLGTVIPTISITFNDLDTPLPANNTFLVSPISILPSAGTTFVFYAYLPVTRKKGNYSVTWKVGTQTGTAVDRVFIDDCPVVTTVPPVQSPADVAAAAPKKFPHNFQPSGSYPANATIVQFYSSVHWLIKHSSGSADLSLSEKNSRHTDQSGKWVAAAHALRIPAGQPVFHNLTITIYQNNTNTTYNFCDLFAVN